MCLTARDIELEAQKGFSSGTLLRRRDLVAAELLDKMEKVRNAPPPNIKEYESVTQFWRDRIKNKLKFSDSHVIDAKSKDIIV